MDVLSDILVTLATGLGVVLLAFGVCLMLDAFRSRR